MHGEPMIWIYAELTPSLTCSANAYAMSAHSLRCWLARSVRQWKFVRVLGSANSDFRAWPVALSLAMPSCVLRWYDSLSDS